VSHRSALSLWSLLPVNQVPIDVIVSGYGGRARRDGIRVHRSLRTRSDLEADFLWLCRRHRLPPLEVNVRIGPYLVDFFWRERRFVVETDSYIYHRGEVAFQEDRARDLDLMRRGFEVLRLSELQLDEEPVLVAEVLARRLELADEVAQQGQGAGR
jgi:very-short-patch-repair endonuclease